MDEKIKSRIDLNEIQCFMVGMIYAYCKEHYPHAEKVTFAIDGLLESIKYGDKGCSTDSNLTIYDKENNVIIENF